MTDVKSSSSFFLVHDEKNDKISLYCKTRRIFAEFAFDAKLLEGLQRGRNNDYDIPANKTVDFFHKLEKGLVEGTFQFHLESDKETNESNVSNYVDLYNQVTGEKLSIDDHLAKITGAELKKSSPT